MSADPTELEFINDQERQYFAEAVIGVDIREFLASSTGRFLRGCAEAEYNKARDRMFEINPYTPTGKQEYEQLKADAWAASHFTIWCVEAMQRGNESETMLKQMRQGEER